MQGFLLKGMSLILNQICGGDNNLAKESILVSDKSTGSELRNRSWSKNRAAPKS